MSITLFALIVFVSIQLALFFFIFTGTTLRNNINSGSFSSETLDDFPTHDSCELDYDIAVQKVQQFISSLISNDDQPSSLILNGDEINSLIQEGKALNKIEAIKSSDGLLFYSIKDDSLLCQYLKFIYPVGISHGTREVMFMRISPEQSTIKESCIVILNRPIHQNAARTIIEKWTRKKECENLPGDYFHDSLFAHSLFNTGLRFEKNEMRKILRKVSSIQVTYCQIFFHADCD
jgi:hypothetical protein